MDGNIMDQLAQALPGRWGVYAPLVFLTLSGLCNILAIGLKPPTWGSKNYALRKIYYLVVTWGALNLGHAANRLQCERTGLMVKREDVDRAIQVLSQNGISVLNKTKPPT